MLNHEHTVVFGSCNISATSETVGPHSANVGKKHVLSPTAKLISDYLIESEIDLTGEKSRARSCVWTQWIKCMTFSFYVQQFLRLVRAIG